MRRGSFLLGRAVGLLGAAMLMAGSLAFAQTTVDLEPAQDNTLYNETASDLSNGAGMHCFAGRNNQAGVRRALTRFDIAGSVPEGATILSVELTITVTSAPPDAPDATLELHRALADWGEGASDAPMSESQGAPAQPGDATWRHRFFDADLWTTEGGDFEPIASGSLVAGEEAVYTFASAAGMVADVQGWLDDPSTNFGWIMTGDESANGTIKRFDSRTHPTVANRPRLTVIYTTPASVDHWTIYE
jgi:hypothetical protein